jgi:hypothetical protein
MNSIILLWLICLINSDLGSGNDVIHIKGSQPIVLPQTRIDSTKSKQKFLLLRNPARYHYYRVKSKRDLQAKLVHKGTTSLYKIDLNGRLIRLWSIQGYYHYGDVCISNDGKSVIFIDSFPSGSFPDKGQKTIAFYRNGKLVKSYAAHELLKEHDKVSGTSDYFTWLAYVDMIHPGNRVKAHENPPEIDDDDRLVIKTVEGIIYKFNIENGNIIESIPAAPQ